MSMEEIHHKTATILFGTGPHTKEQVRTAVALNYAAMPDGYDLKEIKRFWKKLEKETAGLDALKN